MLASVGIVNEHEYVLRSNVGLAATRSEDSFVQRQLSLKCIQRMVPGSNLPCFVGGEEVIPALRARFCMNMTEKQLETYVNYMIDQSLDAFSTKMYDNYQVWQRRLSVHETKVTQMKAFPLILLQYYTNGIL